MGIKAVVHILFYHVFFGLHNTHGKQEVTSLIDVSLRVDEAVTHTPQQKRHLREQTTDTFGRDYI